MVLVKQINLVGKLNTGNTFNVYLSPAYYVCVSENVKQKLPWKWGRTLGPCVEQPGCLKQACVTFSKHQPLMWQLKACYLNSNTSKEE